MKDLIIDFNVFQSYKESKSCVICLAGRSGNGGYLARRYQQICDFPNTNFIGVTPWTGREVEWYPQPHSATDQGEAVAGLEVARGKIEAIIYSAEKQFDVPRNKIAVIGFSAGAVMALHTITHTNRDLAGVVVHSGASLQPNKIPKCQNKTDILLAHGEEDWCFDWYERYLPMKNRLIKRGYRPYVVENPAGHHVVTKPEIAISANFLAPRLGYDDYVKYDFPPEIPLSIELGRREKIPENWKEISDRKFKIQYA